MRSNFSRRRGISAVQWIVVAALVVLVVFGTAQVLGNRSSTKMNQTASDLTNPANLTQHMGS